MPTQSFDQQSILPPAIVPGDTIGVFAPSSYVEAEDIEKSKALLEEKGYKVFIHPQTYERELQSAGNHLQKSLAFQGLWQRKDIKAIWAAGGGNRCLHLLDTINFARLKRAPKTLIGFSDVTALLNAVYAHTGIASIHGPVFKNLYKHQEIDYLLDLLSGKQCTLPVKAENILSEGTAAGPLIGGNLSIFQYLPQTLPEGFYDGAILFLEDCNEELSHIDRMLLHLKRTGVLRNIAALALGQLSPLKDSGRPFGYTLTDIIKEHTEDLDIPVLYDLPFGHGSTFYPLTIGVKAYIDTKQNSFHISPATEDKK